MRGLHCTEHQQHGICSRFCSAGVGPPPGERTWRKRALSLRRAVSRMSPEQGQHVARLGAGGLARDGQVGGRVRSALQRNIGPFSRARLSKASSCPGSASRCRQCSLASLGPKLFAAQPSPGCPGRCPAAIHRRPPQRYDGRPGPSQAGGALALQRGMP